MSQFSLLVMMGFSETILAEKPWGIFSSNA
jgi:hypothetical protein